MKERPILFSGPMVKALLAGTKTQTRRIVKLRDGSLPDESSIATFEGGTFDKVMDFSKAYPHWQPLPCPYGQPGDRLWVKETFSTDAVAMYPCPRAWYRATDFDFNTYLIDGHVCPEDARGRWADCLACWEEREGRKFRWKPSIFMRRQYSRITLEIESVRVERLQDISEADGWQEGITYLPDAMHSRPLQTFANLCAAFPKTDLGRLAADDMKLFQFGNDPKQRSDYEKVVGTTGRGCYAYLWESINGPGSWAANPWVWVVEFKRKESA